MATRVDAAGSDASAVRGNPDFVGSPTSLIKTDSYLPEIVFAAIVLTLGTIRVIEERDIFTRLPGSDWNSSEWMIDYAGGFVRRGLSGAFLEQLMRLTHLGFLPIWIAITTAAYISACAYMLSVSFSLRGPATWRFALLLNPLLLLSALYYGSTGRKDTFFIWGTILIVALCHQVLERDRRFASRTSHTLIVFSAALLTSAVLALLHEGIFLFAWLPLNLMVFAYTLARLRWSARAITILLALTFGPALLAVAASAYRHGNVQTGQAICESWHAFSIRTDCSADDNFPPAVDALTWSFSHGMSLSLKYVWRLPAFLALFVVAASIEMIAALVLIPTARLEHLLVLLLFPCFASLPLFLLGDDWGRWICLVAISSLMVMLSAQLRPAISFFLPATLSIALQNRIVPPVEVAIGSLRHQAERHLWLFYVALILLPIPFNPTKGAMLATPLALVFHFLRHLWTK